jgi:signal transduction histidine kinase/CheY-like chemotaxis protein
VNGVPDTFDAMKIPAKRATPITPAHHIGHDLAALPLATSEQEEIVTDNLFRAQTVDCNPWVEYTSRAVQTVLPPILFYRYAHWTWLLAWELLWFAAMGWRIAMAAYYRRHFPFPKLPEHTRLWSLVSHGYQAYGWFVVGLVGLFCFLPSDKEWQIAAVAGLGMVFTVAPYYSHRGSEVIVSAVAMPLPIIAMLLYQGSPLQYALAALMIGIVTILAIWGVQQVGTRRNEVRLRLALQSEKARAEEANIAKSRFLAAASHDLRQPLHALALFVEALKAAAPQAQAQALVDNIERSVGALDDLFNALLDISKLDAGTVVPRPEHFSLAPLLARLDSEFAPLARIRRLDWRCDPNDAWVYTDPVLLDTILRNLLSNAIRYTAHGSVRVQSEVGAGRLRLAVRDTGIGIPTAQQREIFREFRQLHNPERDRSKGLGLGLAIVERLTHLLDIGLQLDSIPGRGSSFILDITLGDSRLRQTSARQIPNVDCLRGKVVAVIDDEADIRAGMNALLTSWGCIPLLGESGADVLAQQVADGISIDLIIVDFRLRDDRTGSGEIAMLRAACGPAIPAMIITGDTAPERLREADAAGFLLLHKPVRPNKLRAALQQLLRGAHPDSA